MRVCVCGVVLAILFQRQLRELSCLIENGLRVCLFRFRNGYSSSFALFEFLNHSTRHNLF